MSHQPERSEKICLNCNVEIYGRYCHVCGQENIVTKQGFWSLAKHFIYDIFHFDGKFFDTLRFLLFRPGYVPREYLKGKRSSYLDPIRMYLFTSAVFFLIFFSMRSESVDLDIKPFDGELTRTERLDYATKLADSLQGNNSERIKQKLAFLLDTTYEIKIKPDSGRAETDTSFRLYHNGKVYNATAKKTRDSSNTDGGGWLMRNLTTSWKKLSKKHNYDQGAALREVGESFMHRFPYLLFISLPFFALILKGLYSKHKNIYYSDHAVFTLYHYIFTFILLLFYFFFDKMQDWTGVGFFGTLAGLLLIMNFVYLYISMHRFYGQRWLKTGVKFLLLNLEAMVLMVILILIFLVFSFLQS